MGRAAGRFLLRAGVLMPRELQPGENRAVDAAVVCDGHVLLIRRGDGGGWAIPGGMVDPGEDDVTAMRRELMEETGVDVGFPVLIGGRLDVDDPRNDPPHCWITTQVGVFAVPSRPHAVAADDAVDACWVSLSDPEAGVSGTGAGIYSAHWPLLELVATYVGGGR